MIYFIGAGSGDPDLITVKGADILKRSDVIIYAGSLVNFDLVKKYSRSDCKLFNSAEMNLNEILNVMKKSHDEKLLLSRLHTGDPSIFGALTEQINYLNANNIPFEIIPGVSSFSAAAASLKLSYTIPELSQKIIISRINGNTPFNNDNAAEIYFLSSGNIKALCEKLLSHGHSLDEKIALVYKASWPDEKIIISTINKLPEQADKHGIKNHALIILGEFLNNNASRKNSRLYDPEFSNNFRSVHS